jgi:photosystem II stability/assembly factor-like uncharacterized protein
VNSLVIDPDDPANLYAGTSHGVLKSTDRGQTWTGANAGLTGSTGGARVLAIDPLNSSTLYAQNDALSSSTKPIAMFKTTDGGKSWSSLNSSFYAFEGAQTPLAEEFVSRMVIDPNRTSVMFALASGTAGGVFRTTDGGATWYGLPGLPPVGAIYALALDPATSTLYVAGNDLSLNRHIARSTDQGATWAPADLGFPNALILGLATDPRNPGTVYAWYVQASIPNPTYGFARSSDSGSGWATINDGIPGDYSFRSLAVAANSNLYAGFQNLYTFFNDYGAWGGIFKSTDGGATWHGANAGPAIVDVPAVTVDPDNPDVLYAAAGYNGIFKSADGGANWTGLGTFQYPSNPFGMIPLAATALATGGSSNKLYAWAGCVLFKSGDAGASWQSDASPPPPDCSTDGYVFTDPHDPNVIYLGQSYVDEGDSWLLKTTDGGISWRHVWSSFGTSSGFFFNAMTIDPVTPAIIYAATSGGLLKSIDGGATWNDAGAGPWISVLAIDPVHPNVLYAATSTWFYGSGFGGLFKSTDAGGTWSASNSGLGILMNTGAPITALAIDHVHPETIYAGTSGNGVFRSTDGGAHWSVFNHGLANLDVRVLAISPDRSNLFAMSSTGLFVIPLFSRRPEGQNK